LPTPMMATRSLLLFLAIVIS